MASDGDILVIDIGSAMCKGKLLARVCCWCDGIGGSAVVVSVSAGAMLVEGLARGVFFEFVSLH